MKQIDPSQALAGEATLGQLIDRNTAGSRFNVGILILFVIGAVVLAAAGIHSVVRESVTVRAKEIALRLALGAGQWSLVWGTTRRALLWVCLGEVAGLALALFLGRTAAELLYGIAPNDPVALISAAAFLLVIASAASTIPAWFAVSQDPRHALQND